MGCSGRTGFGSRKFGLHECSRLKGIWVARLRVLFLGSGAEVIGFIPSLVVGEGELWLGSVRIMAGVASKKKILKIVASDLLGDPMSFWGFTFDLVLFLLFV